MAYLIDLNPTCHTSRCDRLAIYEVRDRWNGSRGKFCRACAKKVVEQLTKDGM